MRSRVRSIVLLALPWLLAALLAGTAALADAPVRIAVVDHGSEEVARKLRAEAMHVGFAVVEARQNEIEDPAGLEESGVVALVRVISADRVELRVNARGHAPYSETFARAPAEGGESFPLRVVEQLRARLVDLAVFLPAQEAPRPAPPEAAPEPAPDESLGPHAPLGPPPAADSGSAPVRPRGELAAPPVWIGGGAAGALPAGGIGPTAFGLLGARFEPDPSWGLGVVALLPLSENELAAEEGEADVVVTLLAAELDFSARLPADWFVGGGAGGGVLLLAMRGEAAPPFAGNEDRLEAGVLFAEASAGRFLADWLRVRATIVAGTSAPRPVVRFDHREAAAWGRAFGGLALRGEVGLPPTSERSP